MHQRLIVGFVSTALLVATAGALAYAQESVVRREIINKTEVPSATGATYVAVQVMAFTAANGVVARHTHPGVESSYVLEGEADLLVEGHPPRRVKAGDAFQIPAGTPHTLRNGPTPAKVIVTFVIEKDKPIASPAPE